MIRAMKTAAKIALLGAFMLRPGLLDDQAKAWASGIPRDWPGSFEAHWTALLKDGKTKALDVTLAGERRGLVLYYIDPASNPPEFVISGAFGLDSRADLTELVLPNLVAIAKEKCCGTVRFHTMRAGLVAKTLAAGFHVSEVIMRRAV